jgi:predicted acetyltransferase
MSIEIRSISQDEYIPFFTALDFTFGGTPNPKNYESARAEFEFDRSVAAFDGPRIVGTAGFQSFEMTLPGGETAPMGGVTYVTVSPTHRRKGILTSMMRRMLQDCEERGEPFAGLMASESGIYGRFGFGLATTSLEYEADTRYRIFARRPEISGSVDLIDSESAATVLPPIYDRMRVDRPGALTRDAGWWKHFLEDPERHREGLSNRRYAVYTAGNGSVDGYASYRVKDVWTNGFPDSTIVITDFVTVTGEARVALWEFCLNLDLVTKVQLLRAPVDDLLPWTLADPRRMRVTQYEDMLWLCVIDPVKALATRRYALDGKLTIAVDDPFRPHVSGTYTVDGGPDGATCTPSTQSPDLSLMLVDLGAGYLGGVSFSTLARAGRVVEHTQAALRRADLMFFSEPAPWCNTQF